jgi:hypothetical protein
MRGHFEETWHYVVYAYRNPEKREYPDVGELRGGIADSMK